MENQPKLNSSKEVIAFLALRFPRCFSIDGEVCPLKIGIFQDLVERMQGDESGLSKTQLRSALRLYTSSWRYLHGVKAGVERIDLDGNACGVLDEQHVIHARQQLNEAKARVQAQRAERQQTKKHKKSVNPTENSASHAAMCRKEATSEKSILSRKEHVQQQGQAPQIKTTKVCILPVADIKQLQIGQEVKINAGKSSMEASVLEVTKDGVRVQLPNGLAMIVRAEHLQF